MRENGGRGRVEKREACKEKTPPSVSSLSLSLSRLSLLSLLSSYLARSCTAYAPLAAQKVSSTPLTSSNSTKPGQRRGAPEKSGVVAADKDAWAASVAVGDGPPQPPTMEDRNAAAAAAMAATGVEAQRSDEKRSLRHTDTVITAPPSPGAARLRKMERTASPGEAFKKPTRPDQEAVEEEGEDGRRAARSKTAAAPAAVNATTTPPAPATSTTRSRRRR